MEQMVLRELEEDHRQRVAAAKLDEAELMDNHSLFSHHSSELNLLKDRWSDRSQRLVQDWVNSFPAGNSLTAASELNFSRPGLATADPPVQDTAPSNPPENASNVADNLNHLEMLSQYTRPVVALSVAQQEALYREYLQVQLQQSLSDQMVEQAHSPLGSGKVKPVNQVPLEVQNVAIPHFNHLCNLPGHRQPLWHQRTPFLYLIFQQTLIKSVFGSEKLQSAWSITYVDPSCSATAESTSK